MRNFDCTCQEKEKIERLNRFLEALASVDLETTEPVITKRELQFLYHRYFNKMDSRELAKEFGISRERAMEQSQKALENISRRIKNATN